MATHSGILAWRQRSLAGYSPWGRKEFSRWMRPSNAAAFGAPGGTAGDGRTRVSPGVGCC